jgi:hypothetical protein
MKNNFLMWGAIVLIIMAIILPITFVMFSCWWLLTGDMVSRLMWFNTSVILTTLIILIMFIVNVEKRRKDQSQYIEIGNESILKKLRRKLFKF